MQRVADAAAGAPEVNDVFSALTVALYQSLAVDRVLLFEVGQNAEVGDGHVMRRRWRRGRRLRAGAGRPAVRAPRT